MRRLKTEAIEEIWKSVLGFEGHYEVSNLGKLKHLRMGLRKIKPNWMGYPTLRLKSGTKAATKRLHTLVMEAFVGLRPKGMQCAHLNGDPSDNRLVNLKWVTHTENQRHRRLHGTDVQGQRHPGCKFSDEFVIKIREDQKINNLRVFEVAKKYGLIFGTASQLLRKRKLSINKRGKS